MKLEISVYRTIEAITREAENDPNNEGLSGDAILWDAGYNHQSAFTIEVEINEEFEIKREQAALIVGFIDIQQDQSEPELDGFYKIGDTLESGMYRFDGNKVIGISNPPCQP